MSQAPQLKSPWQVLLALGTRLYQRKPRKKMCIFPAAFLNGLLEVPIYIQNGLTTGFLIYGPFLLDQWLLMLYLQPLSVGLPPGRKKQKREITCCLWEAQFIKGNKWLFVFLKKMLRNSHQTFCPYCLSPSVRKVLPAGLFISLRELLGVVPNLGADGLS